jgi:hypothetical protein
MFFSFVTLVAFSRTVSPGWKKLGVSCGPVAQTVRMELPEGVKVRQVQALRAGTELKYKVTGQTLEFTLPGVRDYEIAAVTKA